MREETEGEREKNPGSDKWGLRVTMWKSYVSSGIFASVNKFRPCLLSSTEIHFEVFSFLFISASLVFSPSLVCKLYVLVLFL